VKREAIVCDISEWKDKTCPRLADFVCPLCQRDVCTEHRRAKLLVRIQVVWPMRPQQAGVPPKDEVVAPMEAFTGVCTACFDDLRMIQIPLVKTLAAKTMSEAVEAYSADLAAAKLSDD
jgi:hypothetical protein